MATIFPREEKAEALFGEILKNPEACHRLMDTFNDSLDMADVLDAPEISAQQFTTALFNAYANKDLSAFLLSLDFSNAKAVKKPVPEILETSRAPQASPNVAAVPGS